MNTFIKLKFGIRKLAKICCSQEASFRKPESLTQPYTVPSLRLGYKVIYWMKLSSLYQLMVDNGNSELAEAPIIQFTESEF
jgi:hypothetical protein